MVLDASVAVEWYLDEDYAAEALALYRSQPDIHVPDFFYQEVANAFWKRARRTEVAIENVPSWLDHLADIAMTVHQSRSLLQSIWATASGTGIAIYDAAYLAVARTEACPVVTADRVFFRQARLAGYGALVRWIDDPSLAAGA